MVVVLLGLHFLVDFLLEKIVSEAAVGFIAASIIQLLQVPLLLLFLLEEETNF